MPDTRGITESGRDIYTVNFADYLPAALKHDPKMRAIAEALTKEALTVSGEIENVRIYSRMDDLPEALVDILAYDMHVDWYDYSYPLPVKREIVKNSVKVHKRMGTKYAVETALKAVCKTAGVKEWFEYGGQPYWFKVTISIGSEGLAENTVRDIWEKMCFYKNLRSHCEGIFCTLKTAGIIWVKSYAKMGVRIKVKAYKADMLYMKSDTKLLSVVKIKNVMAVRKEEGQNGKYVLFDCD